MRSAVAEAIEDGVRVVAIIYGSIAGGVALWAAVCIAVALVAGD